MELDSLLVSRRLLTAEEAAEATGVTVDVARAQLDALVENGYAERRELADNKNDKNDDNDDGVVEFCWRHPADDNGHAVDVETASPARAPSLKRKPLTPFKRPRLGGVSGASSPLKASARTPPPPPPPTGSVPWLKAQLAALEEKCNFHAVDVKETEKVDALVEKWTTACQEVIQEIASKVPDDGEGPVVPRLLNGFGIDPQVVRYNIEDEDFY